MRGEPARLYPSQAMSGGAEQDRVSHMCSACAGLWRPASKCWPVEPSGTGRQGGSGLSCTCWDVCDTGSRRYAFWVDGSAHVLTLRQPLASCIQALVSRTIRPVVRDPHRMTRWQWASFSAPSDRAALNIRKLFRKRTTICAYVHLHCHFSVYCNPAFAAQQAEGG